jgi:hypothetical protein
LPFTAGDLHGFPFRIRAPHRAACPIGEGMRADCMGLSLIFDLLPTPSSIHIADDGLPAGVHMDMLDGHFLPAATPKVRQRLNLSCECPLEPRQRD